MPEGVTHRRVGGRAPPLAVDVMGPAELHDVPHDEEVTGEPQLVDHVQLVVDLGVGPRVAGGATGAVTASGAVLGQLSQPGHFGVRWRGRVGREAGRDQAQVEGAFGAQGGGPLDHPGVAGEAAGLLRPAAQVGGGGGRQPAVDVVQAAAGPDRGQGAGQLAPGRDVVVDVVGGDDLGAGTDGQGAEGVVAGRVERVAVVPQLDHHVVPAEQPLQPGECGRGRGRAVLDQGVGDDPLAAPGQDHPVVGSGGGTGRGRPVRRRLRRWRAGRPAPMAARVSRSICGLPFSRPAMWAVEMARHSRA